MTVLDYFLYDNRTWSPQWGRDWGLKAATGALAGRADLKAAFDRYCGAMPSDQGQLQGFGEAIGGVRSPKRDGYLLCVTLESSDSFGRPSWVVAGLWCPDIDTLEQVLSFGDPIGSVRALISVETPPSALEIQPAKAAAGPKRRRPSAEVAFHRFEPKSTVREVVSFFLGAARGGAWPPNVLGITATARLAGSAKSFDLVYCFPMDERAERALARVQSPPEPEIEEPPPLPPDEPVALPVSRPPERRPIVEPARPQRPSIVPILLAVFLLIAVLGLAGFLVLDHWGHRASGTAREPSSPLDEETPFLEDTPSPELSAPEQLSKEAALQELQSRLEELKNLEPEDLRQSSGFKAAEALEVLPEYQDERSRVRQAYTNLLEIQGRMVGRQPGNYVAYYYDEDGRNAAAALKLQKIAEILGEAPLGGEDCEILKNAFGFEFESGGSVVRRWCDSLERLETINAALQSLSSKPSPTSSTTPRPPSSRSLSPSETAA